MRSWLLRIILVISGLTGVATFATVALIMVESSTRHLATVQSSIEDGIVSKGRVLTRDHALVLRGLSLDKASDRVSLPFDRGADRERRGDRRAELSERWNRINEHVIEFAPDSRQR